MTGRLSARLLALTVLLTSVMSPMALAQMPTANFTFSAHCDIVPAGSGSFAGELPIPGNNSGNDCMPFTVQNDGSMFVTPDIASGATLAMDLYLQNPNKISITRVNAWLAYDPQTLTGVTLTVSSSFPNVQANETGFFSSNGYAKITAKAGATPSNDERVLVGTVRMKVINTLSPSTVISFFDVGTGLTGKTVAVSGIGSGETLVLGAKQPSLMVRLAPTFVASSSSSSPATSSGITVAPTSSSSSVSSSIASASSSSITSVTVVSNASSSNMKAAAPVQPIVTTPVQPQVTTTTFSQPTTDFRGMQVQALSIGTQGGSAMLAWQPLNTKSVQGYHLYYSTVSGVYTQRRTLTADASSEIVTNLPVGDTYYFAIRAFNASGVESAYSREVGIIIGRPETSTAPLTANLTSPMPITPTATYQPLPTNKNKTVAGATGSSDIFNIFLGIAAVVGMWAAFRRQFASSPVAAV